MAHYRRGRWQEAIDELTTAQELNPQGGGATRFFLAMAQWQLGQKEAARRCYGEAVEWMEKNKPQDDELRRFRAKAAELLGVTEEDPQSREPQQDTDGESTI